MNANELSSSFAPQDLKQGEEIFQRDQVSLSGSSDTQAQAYVRHKGNHRVSLSSEEIISTEIKASCTCTRAKKGRLCQHVWATILQLESIESDFLAHKTVVLTADRAPESAASQEARRRQESYKQQMKDLNKTRRNELKKQKRQSQSTGTASYPNEVEAALMYFSENGFEISRSPSREALDNARKSLAKVFHPDLGGTHEEVLVLNQNFEILAQFFGS